jgi:hypothetical protein
VHSVFQFAQKSNHPKRFAGQSGQDKSPWLVVDVTIGLGDHGKGAVMLEAAAFWA